MFVRPNVRPDSARGDAVVHKGIPIADFGAVACTLNGVPISYQEVHSVAVTGSGFAARKLVISFRQGGSMTFEGPRFGSTAIKTFVRQAESLSNQLNSFAEARWNTLVEKRLKEEHAFRIDDLRFLDTGEVYDNEVYLTNVASPDFSARSENGVLTVVHKASETGSGLASAHFSLGLAAWPIEEVLRTYQRILREKKKGGWDGIRERVVYAMVSLAAVVGAWNQQGLQQRLQRFCKKRGVDLSKLNIKYQDIDYAALALDKRFARSTYNAIADNCRTHEMVVSLRMNELLDDLIEVAADGRRISKVALHVLYEIALFQGKTMSSVPAILDRVLRLKGQGWIEVNDGAWASAKEEKASDRFQEPPPGSEKEARRKAYSYYDHASGSASGAAPPPPEPEPKRWYFAESTLENFRFFGFSAAPGEKELRTAFTSLLKMHHPDRIQMTGTAEEVAAANAMVQEINTRRDWLLQDLADYWAYLESHGTEGNESP
jgi:hypothetical protein